MGTGVDNAVNMLYRWREKRGKSTIASLTSIAACAVLLSAILAAALPGPVRAGEDAGARADSNQLVNDAEALVAQAGQRNPVDSALIRKAIDKLHEAVKIDPRNDSAFVDLGFCYSVLRDGNTAVEMYQRATQINPSGPNFKELADIYMRVGDPDDALMAADAGLVKDPKNARLYNAKGMALNDLQRLDEAAEAFQKAIDLDPNLAVARANLDALNSGSHGRGTIAKHRRAAGE
jgi:tetratricopeptide (TPR) repeat protein